LIVWGVAYITLGLSKQDIPSEVFGSLKGELYRSRGVTQPLRLIAH